jgi:hypothetical protein
LLHVINLAYWISSVGVAGVQSNNTEACSSTYPDTIMVMGSMFCNQSQNILFKVRIDAERFIRIGIAPKGYLPSTDVVVLWMFQQAIFGIGSMDVLRSVVLHENGDISFTLSGEKPLCF